MTTRLEALCAALRARDALIVCTSRTAMTVRGRAIASIADEIRYYKPELLRGLFGARRSIPFACARCGAEVVTEPDARCPWCVLAPTSELTIDPNSSAERAYLWRLLDSEKSSQTSHAPAGPILGQFSENDPTRQHAAA